MILQHIVVRVKIDLIPMQIGSLDHVRHSHLPSKVILLWTVTRAELH